MLDSIKYLYFLITTIKADMVVVYLIGEGFLSAIHGHCQNELIAADFPV